MSIRDEAYALPAIDHARPDALNKSNQPVCDECRLLDFASALPRDATSLSKNGKRISCRYRGSCAETGCWFCTAATCMIGANLTPRDEWAWRAVPSSWYSRTHSQEQKRDRYETLIVAQLTSGGGLSQPVSGGFIAAADRMPSPVPSAAPTCQSAAKPVHVRIPVEVYEDFRVKIDHCLDTHDLCRNISTEWDSTLPLYAINCKTLDLEVIRPTTQYLALSYVWGQRTQSDTDGEALDSPSKQLRSNLPQTIRDAARVVLKLGQTFLWVDKYCIPNSEQKHQYISHMDKVYRGAWCTIVALTSSCVSDGLHGVSMPRETYPRLKVRGRTYTWTMPHLSRELLGKPWSTRGWCYQEAILSPQCLVFTKFQTHLVCKELIYQECFQAAILVNSAYRREPFLLQPTDMASARHGTAFDHRMDNSDLSDYSLHIDQFSRRQLGYDVDGLNGLKGILATLPSHTYWGLALRPAEPDKRSPLRAAIDEPLCHRCAFAYSLAWKTLKDSKRPCRHRNGFPSWSWPSLVANISIHDDDVLRFMYKHPEPGTECPDIHVEYSSRCWLSVDDLNLKASALPKVIDATCLGIRITTGWAILHLWPVREGQFDGVFPSWVKENSEWSHGVKVTLDEQHELFVNRQWRALALSRSLGSLHECLFLLVDDEAPVCHRIGVATCSMWRHNANRSDVPPNYYDPLPKLLEPPMEFHIE